MSEEKPEAVEADVEAEGAVAVIEPPQSSDQMDAVIAISKRIDEYAKAHDTIVGVVVKRSYPGDWVVHKKDGDKDEDQKANMGAAAAERMAAFVGITESNWTAGVKEWSEDRKHFTYAYEADFTFGKRTIHVISRVGTRDKFFGKKSGAWKPLEEVQEDDIKKAAFRACRKEGVRTLLGLRNVPVAKLQQLGFEIAKINFVGFENQGKKLSADETKAGTDGLVEKSIIVAGMERLTWDKKDKDKKTTGEKGVRYVVTDKENVKYNLWAGDGSKRVHALSMREDDKLPVKIWFRVGEFNKVQTYQIERVEGVEESGS